MSRWETFLVLIDQNSLLQLWYFFILIKYYIHIKYLVECNFFFFSVLFSEGLSPKNPMLPQVIFFLQNNFYYEKKYISLSHYIEII